MIVSFPTPILERKGRKILGYVYQLVFEVPIRYQEKLKYKYIMAIKAWAKYRSLEISVSLQGESIGVNKKT